MAKVFKSAAGEVVRGNDLRPTLPTPSSQSAGNLSHNNNRCNISESPRKARVLRRREMLVASTPVHVPVAQLLLRPSDQVSNLTDYHNLQNAQTLKFKYASDIDVASLFRSSDGNGLPVEVRVSRPRAFSHEECRGRQLQEEFVIEGIKVSRQRPLLFDMYIRGEEEEAECYCGSFIHTPPQKKTSRGHQKKAASRSLRLGIEQLMEKMNTKEQTRVMVKLVPRLKFDGDPITVESIRIDYS